MKISLKWLNEYFPSLGAGNDVLMRADLLRQKLPLNGIEIGAWKRLSEGIEGVIVGQVLSCTKHPQADRLNVCAVSTGEGQPVLQIVCGAPNVKAGIKVALAPIGTTLPGNFKIKAASIRGVDSSGMLCSEKELDLSEESQGILILAESAPVGSSFVKALGLNDQVWEVELTPDRADCLSHLGMAREVGRILGIKPALPDFDILNPADSSDVPLLSVEVQASKVCPIYGAQLFEGLLNRPSPEWLRRLLESLGLRSHNSLVDITNYVLMDLGHPLHAFDADKISGSKILVRFAKNGEKIKTLDGENRILTHEDLVIADLEKPLALAGVMGGFDSGVTEKTTRIVLESAVFDAGVVRAMSQRHKIHSDASHRFERGVDAANCVRAAGRASLLIRQLAGGRRRGSYIEVRSDKAEKLLTKHSLNFDMRAIKDVVGIDATSEQIIKALQLVGIESQAKSANVLRVEIPTHRLDLVREIDLVEEIARLLGYDQIPLRYPPQLSATESLTTSLYRKLRQIRHRMVELGLTEMMPYSFISDAEKAFVPSVQTVPLKNPLSNDWLYMRPNLFFGLIKVLARHAALNQSRGSFFDSGAVFERSAFNAFERSALTAVELSAGKSSERTGTSSEGSAAVTVERGASIASAKTDEAAPAELSHSASAKYPTGCIESFHVSWALMGARNDEHWSSDKKASDRKAQVDFFDAKGVAEALVQGLTAIEARWGGTQYVALSDVNTDEVARQAPWVPVSLLHPGRSALIVWPGKAPGQILGYVGELHPQHKGELLNLPTGLQLGAVVGELRVVPDLLATAEKTAQSRTSASAPRGKISVSRRLPVVERDFAFVVKPEVKESEIEKTLRQAIGPELLELKCVDLYRMPDGKSSLAFRVVLQGLEKTLSEEEITQLCKKALSAAASKHGAELRS